jgi:hypothetical protein
MPRANWNWEEGDPLWVCICCGAECNADHVGKVCPANGCEIEEESPSTGSDAPNRTTSTEVL